MLRASSIGSLEGGLDSPRAPALGRAATTELPLRASARRPGAPAQPVPWLPAFAWSEGGGRPLRAGLRLPPLGEEVPFLRELNCFLEVAPAGQVAGLRDRACLALLAGQVGHVEEIAGQLMGCLQGSWQGLVGRCVLLELLLMVRHQRHARGCQQAPGASPFRRPRAAPPPPPAHLEAAAAHRIEGLLVGLLVVKDR